MLILCSRASLRDGRSRDHHHIDNSRLLFATEWRRVGGYGNGDRISEAIFMNRWPMHNDFENIIKENDSSSTSTHTRESKDSSPKLSTRKLSKAWMKAPASFSHAKTFQPEREFEAFAVRSLSALAEASQLRHDNKESLARLPCDLLFTSKRIVSAERNRLCAKRILDFFWFFGSADQVFLPKKTKFWSLLYGFLVKTCVLEAEAFAVYITICFRFLKCYHKAMLSQGILAGRLEEIFLFAGIFLSKHKTDNKLGCEFNIGLVRIIWKTRASSQNFKTYFN